MDGSCGPSVTHTTWELCEELSKHLQTSIYSTAEIAQKHLGKGHLLRERSSS